MGEVWAELPRSGSNCPGLAELPRSGRIAQVWLNCPGPAVVVQAMFPAEGGDSPAAIAQNRPSAVLQLQTRQAFRPKEVFLRPRLHEFCVLRHSRCKRGKLSHQSIQREPSRRGVLPAAIARNRPLRHSSCKRGKHSGQKGRSPSRDCTKSAFYSIPAANAASFHTRAYNVSRRGEVFSRPRLHKTSLLRHSSCKRGKHSGGKGRSPSRDCMKSAFCSTPAANEASRTEPEQNRTERGAAERGKTR